MSGMLPGVDQMSDAELRAALSQREARRRQAQEDEARGRELDEIETNMAAWKRLWAILGGEKPTRDIVYQKGMLPTYRPPAPPAPQPHYMRNPPIIGVRG